MRNINAAPWAIGWVAIVLFGCSSEDPAGSAATTTRSAAPSSGTAATENSSSREVIAEALPYAEIGDELVYGHFAIPVDMIDPLPAILLLHDGRGLTDGTRRQAERIAALGYIVLAVDLFLGKTVGQTDKAGDLQVAALENQPRTKSNIRQAIDFIRVSSGAPGIAVLGIGFGGGMALDAALENPDSLDAVVSFYGQVKSNADDLRDFAVPFLGFYLENDRAVRPQTVRDFEQILNGLGHDATFHILEEGRRGYMSPDLGSHDPALVDRSLELVTAFLDERLARNDD